MVKVNLKSSWVFGATLALFGTFSNANAEMYAAGGAYTDSDGNYVLGEDSLGMAEYIDEFKDGVFQRQLSMSLSGRTISGRSSGNYEYIYTVPGDELCLPGLGCSSLPPMQLETTTVAVNPSPPPPPIPTLPGAITFAGIEVGDSSGGNDTNGSFSIAWGASSNSPTSYQVSIAELDIEEGTTGNWSQVYNGSSTSYSFSSLGWGFYSIRLRACNTNGCSDYRTSGVWVALTPTPGTISTSGISHNSSSQDSNGAYSLSWGNPDNVDTTYIVQESVNNGSYVTIKEDQSTSLSISGKSSGTYKYRVKAFDLFSSSGWSPTNTIEVIRSPSKPSSITGPSTDTNGSYALSWGAASGIVSSYQLQRSTGSWSTIQNNSSRSRPESGLSDNTYSYRVRACNSLSCSGWTSTKTVQVLKTPGTPGSISASSLSHSSTNQDNNGAYSLSWSAASGSVSNYQFQERTNNGSFSTIQNTSSRSISISGKGNATYGYRVRACNSLSCSAWTSIKSIEVIRTPGMPGNISGPSSDSNGSYTLSWSSASGIVSRYQLQRSTGSWGTIQNNISLSRNESGLSDNNYSYRVRACNDLSCSGWTSTKSITVTIQPGTPGDISFSDASGVEIFPGVSVLGDQDGNFTISWGQASNLPTSYKVQQSYQAPTGGGFGAWETLSTTSGTSYSDNYDDGYYKFRVQGCKGSICGSYSAVSAQIYVLLPPSMPGVITGPSSDGDGNFTLSWGAATGSIVFYELEAQHDTTNYVTKRISDTSYTLSGQFEGVHRYRVRACNGSCSDWTGFKSVDVTQGSGPGIVDSNSSYNHPMSINVDKANRLSINIPIPVPVGINNVEPNLSLAYQGPRDSTYNPRRPYDGNPSFIGHGWDLKGISLIAFCDREFADYCLDGQELRTDTNGSGDFYRPAESPETLVQLHNAGSSSAWFEVKSGATILRYGKTSNGRVGSRYWYLEEVVDEFNNQLTISYENSGPTIQPASISYGGNSVEFDYSPRRESFDPSDNKITGEMLDRVTTYSNGNKVREYRLFNQVVNELEYTAAIQMCAFEASSSSANCIPAMKFDWQESFFQFTSDPITQIEDFNNLEDWEFWQISKNRVGITGIINSSGQATSIDYHIIDYGDFLTAQDNEPSLEQWNSNWAIETPFGYGFEQFGGSLDNWSVKFVDQDFGNGNIRRTEYHKVGFTNSLDDSVKGVSRLVKLPNGNHLYELYGPHNGPFPGLPSGGKIVYRQEYTGAYNQSGSELVSASTYAYNRATKDYCGPYVCQDEHISKVYLSRETQYIIDDNSQFVGAIVNQNEISGWDAANGVITEKTATAITGYGSQFGLGDGMDFSTGLSSALNKFDTVESTVTSRTDFESPYNSPSYNIENWRTGFGNRTETEYTVLGRSGIKKTLTTRTPVYGFNSRQSFKVHTESKFTDDNGVWKGINRTTKAYDNFGNLSSISSLDLTDQTNYRYQEFDNFLNNRFPQRVSTLLSQTTGTWADTYYNYDTHLGVVTTSTDPNGQETQHDHDVFGRETLTTAPNGTQTIVTYEQCDASCPVVEGIPAVRMKTSTVTNQGINGAPESITYSDFAGRVIREEVQGFDINQRIVVDTIYDNMSRVVQKSLPYNAATGTATYTDYFYDARGRNWKTEKPDGSKVETSYNQTANGLETVITETIKRNGGTRYFKRFNQTNSLGQLVRSIDAYQTVDAVETDYEYDHMGNNDVVMVNNDPDTTVTTIFDYAGNPLQITDPSAGTTTFAYDGFGQVISQTDARGLVTTFDYDAAGRLIERVDGDGSSQEVTNTFTFDTRLIGELSTKTSNNGFTENYHYNNPNGYSYLTSIVTHVDVDGIDETYTTSMTHDLFGRVYTQSYPSGFVTRSEHNAQGYASAVYDHNSGQQISSIEAMGEFGNVTESTLGYGSGRYTTTRGYNPLNGQLTSINTGNGQIQDYTYQWWSNGTLYQRDTDAATNAWERFTYDNLNRLDQSYTSHSSGSRTLQYDYDKLGNITQRDDNSGGFDVGSYSYNPVKPHQLQSVNVDGANQSYVYDNAGAVTAINSAASGNDRTITYNAYGKPIDIRKGTISSGVINSPTAREQFTYGPDGSRFYKKSKNGSTEDKTVYLFGGMFEVIYPATGTNTAIEKTRAGSVLHIREVSVGGGVTSRLEFVHKDHLGSTDVITDASGNVVLRDQYDPYGTRRAVNWSGPGSAPTIPFQQLHTYRGFTGHEQLDSVGLIHMNGRVYDPQVGRFISPDPIVQAPRYSQSYNRYSYVWNNPVGMIDPSGYKGTCTSAGGLPSYNCTFSGTPDESDMVPIGGVEPDFELVFTLGEDGQTYACVWILCEVVSSDLQTDPFDLNWGQGIRIAQLNLEEDPNFERDSKYPFEDKLMTAVFGALSFAANNQWTVDNYNVGIFVYRKNNGTYYFDDMGPPAAKGFRAGNDFGGAYRERVRGSAALIISVVQWQTIENGYLTKQDTVDYYTTISEKGGGMPVFVKSRGDYRSMVVYQAGFKHQLINY